MKGQMEMIGLVFVVVFIIFALLIYITLSMNSSDNLPAHQISEAEIYAKALQIAMLETTIPTCKASLERTIINCAENSGLTCDGQPICVAAYAAWKNMLVTAMGDDSTDNQITHHAVIMLNNIVLTQNSKTFLHEPWPDECSANSLGYAAPEQPLPSRAGILTFIVKICP